MLKRSLALLFVLVIATQAFALDFEQKSFYGQGLISLPMGDWGDYVNLGFGAGVGMTVPHTDVLSFRGELSYIHYGTDSDFFGDNYDVSASAIPILVLGQYNLQDNPFYLVGGLGFVMMSVDVEYDGPGFSYDSSASDTEIGLVLGGGYAVNEQVSVEGRLNLVSDANSLTIGGVYHF